MIDLNPNHLATVERILAEHVPECEARAFGSRATWTAKDYSDLDLAIVGGGPLDWRTLSRLKEAFEESDLPMRVDVLDWHDISESFRDVIERDYVVVQQGTEQTTAGEWRTATVGEIAEKVAMGPFGSSIKVETFVPKGVPVISGQHLHGFRVDDAPGFNFISHQHAQRLASANVMRGDIVLTHRGTIGQVACIPEDSQFDRYVVSQSQFYMRCDRSRAIPEFVTMYFRSPQGQHQLLANTSQVGVPSIAQPVTYLRTIEIPLPPLPEQRAIAHILGTLDDKIELNRRMNETLEAMARALFQSWFVDFDPVRAKMEGRDTGLPPDLAALFPDRLVNSELGLIPEGWEVRALGEVIELHDSLRIPLNSRQRADHQGTYPYYGAAGVMDYVDDFLFDGVYVLTGEDGSVTDNDGYPVVQYTWGKLWVNNHAHVMRGAKGVTEEHLYILLNHTNIGPFVTGAVQPKLNQNNLKAVPFLFPGQSLCKVYGGLLQPLFSKVRGNTDESSALTTQRDALLPRLVSGSYRPE